MNKLLKDNVPYEMKYPRNKFTVTLKGKGINGFPNTYEARLNELKRCKPKVTHIIKAELLRESTPEDNKLSEVELLEKIRNDKSEKREIRIDVTSYDEVMEVMKPWSFDSFNKGVIPSLEPIENLGILFFDMGKYIEIKTGTITAKKLEQEYGIINVERIFIKNDLTMPARMMRAKVVTIKGFVESQVLVVPIGSCTRLGKPQINFQKNCLNCGQINHFKCDQEKICFKCGEGDHTTDKCKKALRCVNCKRSHRRDSEECELLRKKTYQLNDYTISILFGESVTLVKSSKIKSMKRTLVISLKKTLVRLLVN